MSIKKTMFLFTSMMSLAACSNDIPKGPVITHYDVSNAQQLNMNNSMLGGSCLSYSPTLSNRMRGNSYMYVTVKVTEINKYKTTPYTEITGPADWAISSLAAPTFHGMANTCTGNALKTIIRRENGKVYLDWWLEFTPEKGESFNTPWLFSGRTEMSNDAYASGEYPVKAFGKNFIVSIDGTPGQAYLEKWRHEQAMQEGALFRTTSHSNSQLPDEDPDRSLSSDMVNK